MEPKKIEILSNQIIKPSSPTPENLREFKISFLDQLAPSSIYIPIILFYSASDINSFLSETNFKTISDKLKSSLSDTLNLYYPFCGRLKDNSSVECNDEGVLYIESKVSTNLSDILNNPQVHEIIELFPFDPYNPGLGVSHKEPAVNMAVQLNEFGCGGIGIGVCFSHKIADGATTTSFLKSWAEIARVNGNIMAPKMEASLFFPPRNIEIMDMSHGIVGHKNIVTRRFIFNEASLSRLRDKLVGFNPTRVEAVTALLWKSAIESIQASSKEHKIKESVVSHAVNIRNRMTPPLSNDTLGNLWQQVFSRVVKVDDGVVKLLDLARIVRETVRKVDADYVGKIQDGDGFGKVIESLKEARIMVAEKGIPCYSFSSWARFGFYEADFGWGKPNWVCTIGVPIENVIILMATRDGGGIEAWVTFNELDMAKFQCNSELLQFASL